MSIEAIQHTNKNPEEKVIEKSEAIIQAENITLLPESSYVSIEEIEERFGKEQPVFVCDFYLTDIDTRGNEESCGLIYNNIINIDHHAPIDAMKRRVSSATLALEYVLEHGAQKEAVVVANHTDCDSTLSTGIIRGTLSPDEKFSEAAIAADHTGEPNEIADLLQALDSKRDLDFSLRNLNLLLAAEELEEEAQALLEKRLSDRERAKTFVESSAFKMIGTVAYAETTEKFDGAFLPSLLPDAEVILLASPFKNEDGSASEKNEVKVRLGKNSREGMTLDTLGLKDTDLNFGGRWNAGNNKRRGGTLLSVEECAEIVHEKIEMMYN